MILKKNFKILLISYIFIFTAIFTFNAEEYNKYSKTNFAMSTYLTITLFSDNKKNAEKILDDCFKITEELSSKVDRRNSSGIIFKLNEKKEMIVNDDFAYKTILLALKNTAFTNGAFDPALGNIIKLWGIEDGNTIIPSRDSIEKTMKECGYKNIVIDGKKIILKDNINLDLGGIAKESIMMEIRDYLLAQNIKDFLINAGGDIIANGLYNGVRLWKIAVQSPFKEDAFIGTMEITDCSIITSGDYQRYFIGKDGKRYHHIIDPRTGYPAISNLHSVTVITKNPTKENLLTTSGYFVMGDIKGIKFAEEQNLNAIFVSGDIKNPIITHTKNVLAEKTDKEKLVFKIK